MTRRAVPGFALEPLAPQHPDEVLAVFADPRVSTHPPSGRRTGRGRSTVVIERAEASRRSSGLGAWAVREVATGRLAIDAAR